MPRTDTWCSQEHRPKAIAGTCSRSISPPPRAPGATMSVGSLCRRQRSVSPPFRHEREEVIEERNVRHRSDFAVLIPPADQLINRFVIRHPRLRIADVVELHDVARSEQLACEATHPTRFKRKSFADFTAIGEVEAVVVRRRDSLVQRSLDALIFIRRNRQREVQRRRDWTS